MYEHEACHAIHSHNISIICLMSQLGSETSYRRCSTATLRRLARLPRPSYEAATHTDGQGRPLMQRELRDSE
jgi:hypothetical protein